MELLYKPDYATTRQRFGAFRNREIIDSPPVSISMRKSDSAPTKLRRCATYEEQWLDIDDGSNP